eukprot:gene8982-16118_t
MLGIHGRGAAASARARSLGSSSSSMGCMRPLSTRSSGLTQNRLARRSVVVTKAAMFDKLSLSMEKAAMFDKLSRSMEKAYKSISKDGKITPENVKEPLKDIRRALLEADVSLPVVRRFIKKVIVGVTPDVQFIKVVNDELIELMGSKGSKDLEQGFPQGVGKTTACGKLALYLKKAKKSVMMVATDVYRPAAIEQLVKLGQSIDVFVFEMGTGADPVEIARLGVEEAKRRGMDAVIVDTAGRLQVACKWFGS